MISTMAGPHGLLGFYRAAVGVPMSYPRSSEVARGLLVSPSWSRCYSTARAQSVALLFPLAFLGSGFLRGARSAYTIFRVLVAVLTGDRIRPSLVETANNTKASSSSAFALSPFLLGLGHPHEWVGYLTGLQSFPLNPLRVTVPGGTILSGLLSPAQGANSVSTTAMRGRERRALALGKALQALPRATIEQRFFSKVEPIMDDRGCWEWIGAKYGSGYGLITIAGQMQHATRVSMALAGHRVEPQLDVLHSCDNPPCVNPAHLRLGTHRENMDDRNARGRTFHLDVTKPCPRGHVGNFTFYKNRHGRVSRYCRFCQKARSAADWIVRKRTKRRVGPAVGERNAKCKWTSEQVAEMRGTCETAQEIVQRYGVSLSQAYRILKGQSRCKE